MTGRIFGIKIYDKNGKIKKELSVKQALNDFNFDKKRQRSVFFVTPQERKQFWGRPTRVIEPKKIIRKKDRQIDGRKNRQINKPREFKYKITCNRCGKKVIKQSEKAEFCSFKCQHNGSRARQYIKIKKRKSITDAMTFYLRIRSTK